MLQAFQIMLAAAAIAIVTGFLISVMIQILCRIVGAGNQKPAEDDGVKIAIAIAVALRQAGKK